MNTSPTIGAIAAALAKAQTTIGIARKDAINPHFKSKYADLASVDAACRPHLSAVGVAIVQGVSSGEAGVTVTTRLCHESGEWLESALFVPVQKWDAQGVGSAITYGRRFSLAAMAGVAPDDDDGEAAVGRQVATAAPGTKTAAPVTRGRDWLAEATRAGSKDAVRAVYTDAASAGADAKTLAAIAAIGKNAPNVPPPPQTSPSLTATTSAPPDPAVAPAIAIPEVARLRNEVAAHVGVKHTADLFASPAEMEAALTPKLRDWLQVLTMRCTTKQAQLLAQLDTGDECKAKYGVQSRAHMTAEDVSREIDRLRGQLDPRDDRQDRGFDEP